MRFSLWHNDQQTVCQCLAAIIELGQACTWLPSLSACLWTAGLSASIPDAQTASNCHRHTLSRLSVNIERLHPCLGKRSAFRREFGARMHISAEYNWWSGPHLSLVLILPSRPIWHLCFCPTRSSVSLALTHRYKIFGPSSIHRMHSRQESSIESVQKASGAFTV